MPILPTNIAIVDERTLRIDWSDGQQRLYAFRELLDSCPCAGCRESRKSGAGPSAAGASPPANPLQLTILSPAETLPLRVVSMRPVGNYAYSIQFSDGHDSGIFTFEFLRSLGSALPS